jgi:hypothetical protein
MHHHVSQGRRYRLSNLQALCPGFGKILLSPNRTLRFLKNLQIQRTQNQREKGRGTSSIANSQGTVGEIRQRGSHTVSNCRLTTHLKNGCNSFLWIARELPLQGFLAMQSPQPDQGAVQFCQSLQ